MDGLIRKNLRESDLIEEKYIEGLRKIIESTLNIKLPEFTIVNSDEIRFLKKILEYNGHSFLFEEYTKQYWENG